MLAEDSMTPASVAGITTTRSNRIEPSWWVWALRGLLAIMIGSLAIAWPGMTISLWVRVFSAYILVDGAMTLMKALKIPHSDPRWMVMLFEGFTGLIVGASLIFLPLVALAAIVRIIGYWANFSGMLKIVQAIRLREDLPEDFFRIIGGALSILIGMVLMLWPINGTLTLMAFLGSYAAIFGILMLIVAIRAKALA